jgi:hypothetical protein
MQSINLSGHIGARTWQGFIAFSELASAPA